MMNNDNVAPGDKAMILLQSLICYLREKNVLSRADIEELRNRVEARMATPDRSEEHTSGLQSLMRISYAVFCLKKKNIITTQNNCILITTTQLTNTLTNSVLTRLSTHNNITNPYT